MNNSNQTAYYNYADSITVTAATLLKTKHYCLNIKCPLKIGDLLTPGDKSLYILWVDGECLVEALEGLHGGARLEVLDALVHVLEGPVARLLAPQLTRAPVGRELALKKKTGQGVRFSIAGIFMIFTPFWLGDFGANIPDKLVT